MNITRASLLKEFKRIENEFPNKQHIYLDDVVTFIEDIVGTKVDRKDVKEYLIIKGYKKIDERLIKVNKSLPEDDDDFDIDEFLSSDPLEFDLENGGKELNFSNNTELVRKYQVNQDEVAFQELILNNIGLVKKIANSVSKRLGHKLDYEELVSEGIFGLIKAIKRFNFNSGYQLSTYATWWIRSSIERAIYDTGFTIRLPVHVIEDILKLKKVERELELEGIPIEMNIICEKLNISVEKYEELKKIENQFLIIPSLNTYVSNEDNDTELIDFISNESTYIFSSENDNYQDPLNKLIDKEMKEKIYYVLNSLKEREKGIIIERFGLNDDKPKTLEEIGKIYGVTRERIRQIESKALRKLKHKTRKKILRDYVNKD
jgi:RNA polymerase primary sigma factor